MNPQLLDYLCDPLDKSTLTLRDPQFAPDGSITSGSLVSASGRSYPIRDGVPRFVQPEVQRSVVSFGDEWNHFNFDEFRINWMEHTVRHTFGSLAEFKDKLVVDCGAGSGVQSRWISEAGAKHVIALELSHSVDDVMNRNLAGLRNVDIVLRAYSRIMAALRMVPLLGWFLEKSLLVIRGDVPAGPNYLRRAYRSAALNTFDCYGSHSYQHMKTDDEIRALVAELQPDSSRVLNADRYFLRPQPVGIALRLRK